MDLVNDFYCECANGWKGKTCHSRKLHHPVLCQSTFFLLYSLTAYVKLYNVTVELTGNIWSYFVSF